MTPGVDGETLDGMGSPRIERIISAYRGGTAATGGKESVKTGGKEKRGTEKAISP